MNIITKALKQSTWAELKAAAEAGALDSVLQEGDLIPFTLKTGEEAAVRVTQDEGGKWFFILDNCLDDEHAMNKTAATKGGWETCEMRKWLNKTVFALLPDDLQTVVAPTKIVQILAGERVETEDKLFLPSRTQVFGKGAWTDREPEDTQLACFKRERNRVKECGSKGTWFWWLRSATNGISFRCVNAGGSNGSNGAYYSGGVALGFCLI